MTPTFSIGNRWKIILYCTGFNLLFEYAVRGITNILVLPLLPIPIFAVYFTYFTIFEDLIVRYKMRDYQVLIVSFFIGIFIMAFTGGQLFNPRPQLRIFYIFGINYIDFLFVNLIWWSLLQTILTYYMANRISQRDWNHKNLGKLGWGLSLCILGLSLLIFQLVPIVPKGDLAGYISMTILVIIFGLLSFRILKINKNKELIKFESSKFYDFLMISTIFVTIFCVIVSIFIHEPIRSGASIVNKFTIPIVVIGSLIIGITFIIYRTFAKRQISV